MGGTSVRLKNFYISGYRSCKECQFQINPALSALIGPNSSGKTNVLQSILLLKKLSSFRHNSRPQSSSELETSSTCSLRCSFTVGEAEVAYSAKIYYVTNEFNADELSDTEERWEIKLPNGKTETLEYPLSLLRDPLSQRYIMWVQYKALKEQKRRIQAGDTKAANAPLSELLHGDLQKIERESRVDTPSRRLLDSIGSFISRINYYSASQYTNPADCPAFLELDRDRDSSFLYRRYGAQRTSHTRFLRDLYSLKQNNKAGYEEYEHLVGQAGIKLIDNIEFHRVELPSSDIELRTGGKIVKKQIKRVLVVPHFIINDTKLSPAQLSEGTFKTLAVILYLATDRSDLLLLEEPEVCIHHGLLSSLLELIKSYAKQKQIILTTHSDFVLDQLVPENILLVTNTKDAGTVVTSLTDSLSGQGYGALKEYLNTTGNLGEYWKHMGFEDA